MTSWSQVSIKISTKIVLGTGHVSICKLVKLPNGIKSLGCRWVFKLKWDDKSEIVRHKPRLKAQGFKKGFMRFVKNLKVLSFPSDLYL